MLKINLSLCSYSFLNLLMSVFLLASTAAGYIMLKRSGRSMSDLTGVGNFFAVSVVIFCVATCRLSLSIMYHVPAARTIVPDWYALGIVHCLCGFASGCALLFFVYSAVYAKHVSLGVNRVLARISVDSNNNSNNSNNNIDIPLLDPKVPRAYDV